MAYRTCCVQRGPSSRVRHWNSPVAKASFQRSVPFSSITPRASARTELVCHVWRSYRASGRSGPHRPGLTIWSFLMARKATCREPENDRQRLDHQNYGGRDNIDKPRQPPRRQPFPLRRTRVASGPVTTASCQGSFEQRWPQRRAVAESAMIGGFRERMIVTGRQRWRRTSPRSISSPASLRGQGARACSLPYEGD